MDKNININNTKNVGYEVKNYKTFNMRFGFKSVLSIIFIILVICMVVRLSTGNEVVTFYGFLDFLSNFNVSSGIVDFLRNISDGIGTLVIPDLSFEILGAKITIFNDMAQIINVILKVNEVLLWLLSNLVYIITFIIKFVQFIFVI